MNGARILLRTFVSVAAIAGWGVTAFGPARTVIAPHHHRRCNQNDHNAIHCRIVSSLEAASSRDSFTQATFDPCHFSEWDEGGDFGPRKSSSSSPSSLRRPMKPGSRPTPKFTPQHRSGMQKAAAATGVGASTVAVAGVWSPLQANAAFPATGINLDSFKNMPLTVENFQPVCATSDGFYRILQQSVAATVGPENYSEYGPLIASGLLRVRLELCVVESFFNEAVGPFIRDNGLSWILPMHETVETFIAGGVFAVATTFILIGSTKLVTVIVTYADFLIGLPARLFGGFAFDRAQGKPVTLDIGLGPFKTRVIGPPKESETNEGTALKDISPWSFAILVISGAVNYFGQAMRVRTNLFFWMFSVCESRCLFAAL